MRTFTVDSKGNDHVLQFSMEGFWIAHLNSFGVLLGDEIKINAELQLVKQGIAENEEGLVA